MKRATFESPISIAFASASFGALAVSMSIAAAALVAGCGSQTSTRGSSEGQADRGEAGAIGLDAPGDVLALDASHPHDAGDESNGGDGDAGGTPKDASAASDSSPACHCTAPATCGGGGTPGACGYSTNFPANPLEMPISEGGIWWNGQQTGRLWSDVFAGLGRAYGAPTNTANGSGQYDDPTAILKGSWNPDQKVTGRAFCSNNVVDHISYPEVELRLRFTISANVARGYEIMWRCSDSNSTSLASSYLAVAAWLGGSGQFTGLAITLANSSTTNSVAGGGVEDGDTVSAAIYASTISIYRNGQLQGTVNDSRYTAGNPGMGFNYVAADNGSPASGYNVDFGFTSFSATELLAAP